MQTDAFADDSLAETIIECIITVHRQLGPGFRESVFRNALVIELTKRSLRVDGDHRLNVYYDGHIVVRRRLDLVGENEFDVELKTVEQLGRAQYARVHAYLKASGLRAGILVNFSKEKADFHRVELP